MYIDSLNLLFIHCPKTGGNTIASVFLPYSSDNKVVSGHQDGVNRFEIVGKYTKRKHQTLDEYYNLDGGEYVKTCKIFTSLRHPVDRMVSWYFSPHRWMCSNNPDSGDIAEEYYYKDSSFDISDFSNLVNNEFKAQSHWLTLEGSAINPTFIIDFSNFADSLSILCRTLSVDYNSSLIVNKSFKARKAIEDIVRDPAVRDIVRNSPHSADWDNFPEMNWD